MFYISVGNFINSFDSLFILFYFDVDEISSLRFVLLPLQIKSMQ